ncbi:MAG: ParB/RepB/Spo0J family partition protein, partial [Gammaproteobacteria bacterium]|nr:ParB/RepB/Spo0J family partition protein [Gammaproteobacteria bacterium]
MVKKRGLNRGLQALLQGAGSLDVDLDQAAWGNSEELQHLPVEWLQRGIYQPRRDLDQEALEELAASVRQHGIMQPIVVRPVGVDRYEIIAGERRWRAAQLAELENVPALIKDVVDEVAIAMALIENIQREDLNAMEEAMALQRLQEEFALTQQQIADTVGKSRSAIANLLRLLQLPESVRLMLERGDLEMGHARSLLTLEADVQQQAAREVVAKGLSVRQTEDLVRRLQQPKTPDRKPAVDADV